VEALEKQFVVFIDIDGTLMGKSEKALQRNLDVIQKVRSLGHKVFVNTGRSTAFLPKHIDFEKFFDGVVSGAGARIVFDGKEIFYDPVGFSDIKCFCKIGFKQTNTSVLEGVDSMVFLGDYNEGHDEWIQLRKDNFEEVVTESLKIEKFTVLGTATSEISE